MTDKHIECEFCGTTKYECVANEVEMPFYQIPMEVEADRGHVCDDCIFENDWILSTSVGLWAFNLKNKLALEMKEA